MKIALSDLKNEYGEEYPAAVVMNGVRIPLSGEKRFSRWYYDKALKRGTELSRFMDGSAAITASELQREWPGWDDGQRLEFCQACSWLQGQSDFPEMLSFIMRYGGPQDWQGIALIVASVLPLAEAHELLNQALAATEHGLRANLLQAIACSRHPEAEAILRRELAALMAHKATWKNDKYSNEMAFDATVCVKHLIGELGVQATEFEEQVRKLSQHVCPLNRDICRNYLFTYYPWMPQSPCPLGRPESAQPGLLSPGNPLWGTSRLWHWSTRMMAACAVVAMCSLFLMFGSVAYQCVSAALMSAPPDTVHMGLRQPVPLVALSVAAAALILMVAAGVAGRRWRAIGILLVLLACIAGTTLLGMMFVPSLTHALLWTTVGRQCPLHPTRPHSGIVP